ncbi:carbohydrate-binding domain-containing protein [Actinoplanes sp. NPDC000266]
MRKLAAALAFVLAAFLAACSDDSSPTSAPPPSSSAASSAAASSSAAAVLAADQAVHAAAAADPTGAATLTLSGASASTAAPGVKINGNTVTIAAAGVYRLTGTLNGQIVVTAPKATVTLVLDNAVITSSTTAAIAAVEAGQLDVVLASGSSNSLADASSYAENADVNAALFSAGDLTVSGDGTLTVTGNGNDGIASKDGLLIASGRLAVKAGDDGLRGKDYLVVRAGTIQVTAGGDGLKADNEEDAEAGFIAVAGGEVSVTAGGDGFDAATDLVLTGGTVKVTAGGGHETAPAGDPSTKGLKSGVITVLEAGTATVDASDDAVHSDGAIHLAGASVGAASGDDGVHAEDTLRVSAGTVKVTSSVEGFEAAHVDVTGGDSSIVSSDDGLNAAGGDGGGPGGGGGEQVGDYTATVTGGTLVIDSEGDGFDSNGTASISGGTVVVSGPSGRGNGALDVNGTFTVSGGTVFAAGSASMPVAPAEDSSQAWLAVTPDAAVPAGTTVQVTDTKGKVLATFMTHKPAENIVFSSGALKKDTDYRIYTGGRAGGDDVGGLASSGSLGPARQIATVTSGVAPEGGWGRRPGR